MSISDELRRWCDEDEELSPLQAASLSRIADRIDNEMMELPKDADGVPIHVGDTVYLEDGCKAEVTRIGIGIGMGEGGIYAIVYGDNFSFRPDYSTHERPDSFERIADELEEWSEDNRVNGDNEIFSRAREIADRIRELAEKEGE